MTTKLMIAGYAMLGVLGATGYASANMMGWGYEGSSMMGWGFGGGLFMLIWWAIIIAGIVLLVRWVAGQTKGAHGGHDKTPLDILKERYAKGEINKEEFEAKKKDLA
ncbi:MAG: SHOCT domain-containing protein [Patescibacteria group bacterium]